MKDAYYYATLIFGTLGVLATALMCLVVIGAALAELPQDVRWVSILAKAAIIVGIVALLGLYRMTKEVD
jgi:hypothetical protein